ncbi:MAG TPA: O-antigen ligase family protein [Solirubrobacterales bacterium]|nr:O-antigen ligase family protein [Solirubrobacterales bacterium]
MELSTIEADRILVYLSFFLAAFLIAQTDERRQRFAEGLAIAITLVALLGLASRLLPDILSAADPGGPRLRYPLGYWNANGAMCGMAVGMLLWMTRRAGWAALRWASVAALPAVLLTLYFTYSRGGLLSLVVAVLCLLVLSGDRLWLLASLTIAALATLPAVLAVQDRRELADNLGGQAMADQGVTVLLILLGGIAVTLGAFALLRRLEARNGRLTGKALEMSRDRGLLRWLALAAAVVAVGVTIAVGGRAWDQFSSPDLQFPDQPEKHFGQLSGAGRHDFWRVSVDASGERPLFGGGAGTYEFSWEEDRSINLPVHDAHSLYLETFAELGVVGGLVMLGLVGSLLWWGFASWRAADGAARERYAVLVAVMLAFAVGAAFDWFWELAGLGAVFFLAAGVLIGVRCAQLTSEQAEDSTLVDNRRYGLAIVGLATAWIAAVALIGPLLVEREVEASQAAAARGDIGSAIDRAESARSIEPWAASPYVQLGLLAELQGDYPTAITHFTHAIEREDRNWQLYYLRARVEGAAGDTAAAEADLDKARGLNPRAPELKGGGGQ